MVMATSDRPYASRRITLTSIVTGACAFLRNWDQRQRIHSQGALAYWFRFILMNFVDPTSDHVMMLTSQFEL